MERIIVAQKKLNDAIKREFEVIKKYAQAVNDNNEEDLDILYPELSKAVIERVEAKKIVDAIRAQVLSECTTSSECKIKTRVWIDKEGIEHTIEYFVV